MSDATETAGVDPAAPPPLSEPAPTGRAPERDPPTRIGPFTLGPRLGAGPGAHLYSATDGDGASRLLQVVRLRAAVDEDERSARHEEEKRVARRTAELLGKPGVVVHAHGGADGADGSRLLFWSLPAEEGVPLAERPRRDVGALLELARALATQLAERHGQGRVEPLLSEHHVVLPPTGTSGPPRILGVPVDVQDGWLAEGFEPVRRAPEEVGEAPQRSGDVWRLGRLLEAASANLSVPEPVSRLLESLVRAEPTRRPASGAEVLGDLDGLLASEPDLMGVQEEVDPHLFPAEEVTQSAGLETIPPAGATDPLAVTTWSAPEWTEVEANATPISPEDLPSVVDPDAPTRAETAVDPSAPRPGPTDAEASAAAPTSWQTDPEAVPTQRPEPVTDEARHNSVLSPPEAPTTEASPEPPSSPDLEVIDPADVVEVPEAHALAPTPTTATTPPAVPAAVAEPEVTDAPAEAASAAEAEAADLEETEALPDLEATEASPEGGASSPPSDLEETEALPDVTDAVEAAPSGEAHDEASAPDAEASSPPDAALEAPAQALEAKADEAVDPEPPADSGADAEPEVEVRAEEPPAGEADGEPAAEAEPAEPDRGEASDVDQAKAAEDAPTETSTPAQDATPEARSAEGEGEEVAAEASSETAPVHGPASGPAAVTAEARPSAIDGATTLREDDEVPTAVAVRGTSAPDDRPPIDPIAAAWNQPVLPPGESPWSEVVSPRGAHRRDHSAFPGFEEELPQDPTSDPPAPVSSPPVTAPVAYEVEDDESPEAMAAAVSAFDPRKVVAAVLAVLVIFGLFALIARTGDSSSASQPTDVAPPANEFVLDAEPAGTLVVSRADGRVLGKTPLSFLVPPGARAGVFLVAPDHEPIALDLLERGGVKARLEPSPEASCEVNLQSADGLRVETVGGEALSFGPTPVRGARVVRAAPGQSHVGARLVRCPDRGGGPTAQLEFTPTTPGVPVRITEPAGAAAYLNGEPVGRVPTVAHTDRSFVEVRVDDATGMSVSRWVPARGPLEVRMPAPKPRRRPRLVVPDSRPGDADDAQALVAASAEEAAAGTLEPSAAIKRRLGRLRRAGSRHLKAGRIRRASRSYRECLRIEPNEPTCHRGLGHLYRRIGKVEKARVYYERYLELAPDASDAARIRRFLEE